MEKRFNHILTLDKYFCLTERAARNEVKVKMYLKRDKRICSIILWSVPQNYGASM